jgi:hypothetical protein
MEERRKGEVGENAFLLFPFLLSSLIMVQTSLFLVSFGTV